MSLFPDHGLEFDELRRRFDWRIPTAYNIGADVCDKHVDRLEQTALLLENAAGDEQTWTFGALKAHSNQVANSLAGLGIERGDRVAIVLPQRAEAVIAHIAIYKLAAVALPLAVLFGRDALTYRLRDSGAKIVITDRSRAPLLNAIAGEIDTLERVLVCDAQRAEQDLWRLIGASSNNFEAIATKSDDPALLIYTSGTTGPPKGALNAHRCLLGNMPGFELSQNFFPQPGDLMWTPADWAWTGGLLDALLPALHHGVPVLGYDGGKFDPQKAFALLEKYAVRNAFIPPTALKMLMQVKDAGQRYTLRLRSIMSAGEQLGAEVLAWAKDTLGVEVNEMWGQTEFNYLVGNCASALPIKPGSMGKPYPGHVVEVIDSAGKPMPANEVGELAAKRGDPVMFLGYWRNERATSEKLIGDWFTTGDVGYRDEDGYFWFVGRKDDVISSAGHRVGPGEVEDSLLKHPAIAQAAVIGSPDPLRGSIIKAYVVLSHGYTPCDALVKDIQAMVKTRLAAHEYPRAIEFIDELPMTTSGKVRRIALRERELAAKHRPGDEP